MASFGRRSRFAVLIGVVLALAMIVSIAPASADDAVVSTSVDKSTVAVGGSVTMTVTFTNPDASTITFDYLSIIPTFTTWSTYGMIFDFTGCTGDVTWCGSLGAEGEAVHHTVPIAAGDSRTVYFTYQVAANSPCGGVSVGLVVYSYREDAQGDTSDETNTVATGVTCS